MLLKTIAGLLVLALGIPSTVMAQTPIVAAARSARTWIVSSKPLSAEHQRFLRRTGMRPTTTSTAPTTQEVQEPPERSWAGRHPVALGAMIGAAGGALVGASPCWREVCGDGHGPLLIAFGAGVGAGIGSAVGLTISIARH
jgi:hypothetical protein